MIVDTHCHLDDNRYDDLDEVLENAKQQGVEKFIIPGADPKTLQRAVEIAEKYEGVYFAVGVHPYDAEHYERGLLENFVDHPKCVAIGECGLDYFRLPESQEEIAKEKAIQKEVFIDQIMLAKEKKKPLIVHIRESSSDCLELLEEYAGEEGGVLHCYNADESLLKLAKRNFYYGIGGRLKATSDSRLGLRVPIGLNYIIKDNPLDLFVELVPMLDLVPATSFTINAAIGIRYFF